MRAPPERWLQYANTQGEAPLREALVAWMARRRISAKPDEVIVTTGSQQAFDLILRVLIDPGDTVLVERPTYTTALQALRHARAKVVSVGTDGEGHGCSELERCSRSTAASRRSTRCRPSATPPARPCRSRGESAFWSWPRAMTPWSSKTMRTEIHGSTARTCRRSPHWTARVSFIWAPFPRSSHRIAGGVDAGASRDRAALRHRQADRGPVHVALDSGRGRALHPLRRAGAAPAAHHRRVPGAGACHGERARRGAWDEPRLHAAEWGHVRVGEAARWHGRESCCAQRSRRR